MKIFISYRRADSKYVVDRIRDRLIDAYDEEAVFRDLESIPLGQNFSDVLKESTTTCDVMLVVIGPQWASITDDQGNKRLFEPHDYTRLEVEAGLANNKILVIPLLVMNARMPSLEEIPESLAELRFRNAINIRNDPDFTPDMQRLIQGINEQFPDAVKRSQTKKERKPMDPITLATAATSLLAPFIKKVGEKALDKLAEQVPGTIGEIWKTISSRSEKVTTAAKELASDPDPENEEILKQQFQTALQLALKKDQELASLLTDLVEKAKSESGKTVGRDEIAVSANNNSTAVGKVSIGGSVDGNFVIGNNNQVNSNKKK
jgi:TIR domain-containing protein